VGETSPSFDLGLRHTDVLKELRPLDQRLVLGCIDENGSTPAVLGEDYWPLGALNLAYHRGQVGPEISEGTDILGRSNAGHSRSCLVYGIMYR